MFKCKKKNIWTMQMTLLFFIKETMSPNSLSHLANIVSFIPFDINQLTKNSWNESHYIMQLWEYNSDLAMVVDNIKADAVCSFIIDWLFIHFIAISGPIWMKWDDGITMTFDALTHQYCHKLCSFHDEVIDERQRSISYWQKGRQPLLK